MENPTDNPIVQRLNAFINYTGLTSTQFADKAGIPRPTLSQMMHGRNKSVNNQMLAKLNENFPELNILWFLFGQGSMLNDAAKSYPQNQPAAASDTSLASDIEELAEYQKAAASTGSGKQETSTDTAEISVPEDFVAGSGKWTASVLCTPPQTKEDCKSISSIIVFYSDNSFKTFYPEKR